MAAALHNIVFARGEDFGFSLTIRDPDGELVDVSADTFTAQIRREHGKPIIAEFTCDAATDGENGVVTCTLPQSETLKLDGNIRYKWDLFRESSTGHIQLIRGEAKVSNNITGL